MKQFSLITIAAFTFVLASPAFAEDKIVPVKQGETAPFTGLLVPELRFTEMLETEVVAKSLKLELDTERRFTNNLEEMYKGKLQEATKPPSWHQTTSFNRWFGFTIGVVVTGLAVWGGIEVVKASGNGK